jgi:two-component system, cell cycle response regulator DivK
VIVNAVERELAHVATGRILIVDDNPINLKLARVVLMTEGYDIQTAASAEEAVARIPSWRPDLILMDIQLPGMDGLQLTRLLKGDRATRHIIVVAITAYALSGDERKALDAGCDAYLPKPIDTRALPKLVGRLLPKG